MNILGIGSTELLIVLVIMMVVAGPKRMIMWANLLGQYWVKVRRVWSQITSEIQSELNEAGLDVKIPENPPTRMQMDKWAQASMKSLTKPLQEDGEDLKKELDYIYKKAELPKLEETNEEIKEDTVSPSEDDAETETTEVKSDYGTWSGES